MAFLGVELEPRLNAEGKGDGLLSDPAAPVPVVLIEAREDVEIASQVRALRSPKCRQSTSIFSRYFFQLFGSRSSNQCGSFVRSGCNRERQHVGQLGDREPGEVAGSRDIDLPIEPEGEGRYLESHDDSCCTCKLSTAGTAACISDSTPILSPECTRARSDPGSPDSREAALWTRHGGLHNE